MPDLPQSNLDRGFDQLSKAAGILLPLVVALVGGLYTYEKDRDDARTELLAAASGQMTAEKSGNP